MCLDMRYVVSDYRRGKSVIIIFAKTIILWGIAALTYFNFYPLSTEIIVILKFTLAGRASEANSAGNKPQ